MSEQLKPCPFCGGTNLKTCGNDVVVTTVCMTCSAQGPNHYHTGVDWNIRVAPKVKPLTWTERQTADGRAQWFSDFGHCVTVMDNNRFRVFRTGEEFDLRADAIEAAQGEHERDIRRDLE